MTERHHEVAEERQSLWLLTAAPAIWAAHFLASYIVAALWCGMDRGADIGMLRTLVAGLAAPALAGIGFIGFTGWRKYSHGASERPPSRDTPEDRHRFLGFATLLLSGLSAIATIYTAVVTIFIRSCV